MQVPSMQEFFKMPSDEEIKEHTFGKYKAVEPVLLSRLHPAILKLSIATKFVSISTQEIISQWLPAFDNAKEGESAKQRLLDEANKTFADYPDGFFFKLDSRSPKDTEIPKWTKENVHDLPMAFFSSMRMVDDLCDHRFHRDAFVLCFRQWVELRDEQRAFVKDGLIQGISRYDYTQESPIEYTPDHIAHIQAEAESYLDDIRPYMEIADFVFDFGYQPDGKTILIELNPYGLSDPCFFRKYENISGYVWQD